ncbi:MAG: hypothetical protein IKB75_01860 [Clostridia bacterium]|nr:hypothetical protein [Clostridia bacterium]
MESNLRRGALPKRAGKRIFTQKGAPIKVGAPKNANSDCCHTNSIRREKHFYILTEEFAFLPNSKIRMRKKGKIIPFYKKRNDFASDYEVCVTVSL